MEQASKQSDLRLKGLGHRGAVERREGALERGVGRRDFHGEAHGFAEEGGVVAL